MSFSLSGREKVGEGDGCPGEEGEVTFSLVFRLPLFPRSYDFLSDG
jgi:hypothetical protein